MSFSAHLATARTMSRPGIPEKTVSRMSERGRHTSEKVAPRFSLSATTNRLSRFLLRRELSKGDLALAAAIFVIGALMGSAVLIAVGPGFFYQPYFDPAVSLVCGAGFHAHMIDQAIRPPAYSLSKAPQLLRFLDNTSGTFTCPKSPAGLGPVTPINGFVKLTRYLYYAIAGLWKVFGISWTATYPLFAVLYGLSSAAAFWIARIFVSRVTSIAVAVAFLCSPLQQQLLPRLRDYSAAPFILVAIAAIVTVIWKPLTQKQSIVLAACVGLELGIGFGFRTDMSAALPPFVAVLLLIGPQRSWRSWGRKALSALICLASFSIAAIGVLPAYLFGATNSPLVTLEGSTSGFNGPLSLPPQPLYNSGYDYNDDYELGMVNAYSHLIQGKKADIHFSSSVDDATSSTYLDSIAREIPADFVARSISATAGSFALGPASFDRFGTLSTGVVSDPPQKEPRALADLASTLRTILGFLRYLPWNSSLIPLFAALMLLWKDLRRGILSSLVVIYFGALNVIQFDPKHNFYLEIFWWLSCAIVVEGIVRAGVTFMPAGSLKRITSRPARRRVAAIGITVAAVVALTAGGLTVARWRQDSTLGSLFSSYQASPRSTLQLTSEDLNDGNVLVEPRSDQDIWRGGPRYKEAFLAATFGGMRCPAGQIAPILKYQSRPSVSGWPPFSHPASFDDFSESVLLSFNDAVPTVTEYFVALKTPFSHFSGIELRANETDCLDSLAVVTDTTHLKTLLDATLPTHWQAARRYQVFKFEPSELLFKPGVQRYGDTAVAIPTNLGSADLKWQSAVGLGGAFHRRSGGWEYTGTPSATTSILAQASEVQLTGGSTLVIKGALKSGVVGFALQEGDTLVTKATVTMKGRFAVEFTVPSSGRYNVVGTTSSTGHIGVAVTKTGLVPDPSS
jgi:hypothetical protein